MKRIQKGIPLLVGAFLLVILVGAVMRLTLAHADTTTLVNFVSTVGVIGVPAVASWWNSKQARNHAVVARVAAVRTEHNTNGKLDIKFAALSKLVRDVGDKVDQHLEYHADQDGDKP